MVFLILVFLGSVFAFVDFIENGGSFNLVLSILGAIFSIAGIIGMENEEENKSKFEDELSASYKKYADYIESKNFSLNNAIDLNVKLLDMEMPFPFKMKMFLQNDKLILFTDYYSKTNYFDLGFSKIPYYEIPVSKIRYYLQTGEIITKTDGSGGGSTYSLVTGWNSKIKPVNISTEIKDTKHTRLYFELDKNDIILTFDYDDFHKFKKILPLKDYDIVQTKLLQNESKINKNNSNDFDYKENNLANVDFKYQLRSLKELFDEDIISEEEYSTKKTEILNKM